jgi:protein tyrosine/serine phosphatase
MYRSGQISPERLGTIIDKLGIKTVVNLRGEEDKPWYVAEREVVEHNGARLVNLGFSASRYPDPARLRELLDVIERIEPPFLVHCKGGADRTGLFFVLLALREGQSWSEAMRQLSLLRFNYYYRMKSATITYPLYDFADYADEHHLPRDLKQFRRWLRSDHARQTHQNWLQQQNR